MFRKKGSPKFILSALLMIGSLQVIGQGFPTNLEWQKCYGWNDYHGDEGLKIIPIQDGNYAAIGKKSLNGLETVWASKIGTSGNLIWETTVSNSTAYTGFKAQDIIQSSDGGYILVAKVNNFSNLRFNNTNALTISEVTSKGNFDILVTKLDSEGKMVWFKTFGGDGEDIPVKIVQGNDGNLMLLSYTSSQNDDIANSGKNTSGFNQDLWLAKLDQNGTLLSKKCIGGGNDEIAFDMKKADDGFVIVGCTNSNDSEIGPNKGGKDILAVKIDESINVVWKKTYGGNQKDEAKKVLIQPNGDIIVGLISNSSGDDFQFTPNDVFPNNFEENIWLLRLNSSGELQNKRMFGGSGRDILNDLIATRDGNFAIAGSTRSNNGNIQDRDRISSNNNGAYDAFIMKINNNLDFVWSKTLGGSSDDEGNGLVETNDGAFMGLGTTQSNDGDVAGNHYSSQNNRDIWLYKINYNCEVNITTSNNLVAVNSEIVASETITTSDVVSQNSSIHYGAGKSIDINPGFDTELGTTIELNTAGCTPVGGINPNPIQIKVNNECREGGMKFEFMPFTPSTDMGQYKMSVQNLDPKIEFSFNGNTLITKNNLPNNGNAYFVVKVTKDGYEDFEYQSYTSTCEHDNAPIDCPENDRDVILDKEYYSIGETFTASWTGTLLPNQELSWYNENVETISKTATTFTGKIKGFPAHIQAQPGIFPDSRPCHGSTRVEFRGRK
ncbi:MAG: hypothetical protein U5M51_08815 [Emticicia sp.]|nr:hypothetical protein [Emticicia sp.]